MLAGSATALGDPPRALTNTVRTPTCKACLGKKEGAIVGIMRLSILLVPTTEQTRQHHSLMVASGRGPRVNPGLQNAHAVMFSELPEQLTSISNLKI